MKKRTGFILELNQKEMIESLSDERAGQLLKMIYEYENSEDRQIPSGYDEIVKIIFLSMKVKLDENKQAYEETCERNRKNVLKRWGKEENDTTVYDRIPNDTTVYECIPNIPMKCNEMKCNEIKNNKKEKIKKEKIEPSWFDKEIDIEEMSEEETTEMEELLKEFKSPKIEVSNKLEGGVSNIFDTYQENYRGVSNIFDGGYQENFKENNIYTNNTTIEKKK